MSPENRTAGIFDGAAFGRRAKAPAVFTVGYSDAAATPSSVCAAYNVYGGQYHLWSFPDHGHETAVFFSGEKLILEAAGK
jgi:cephalosporin-C deacetylase